MEQNVSMKINELPSPTWNWLKVNETPIKWSNKIEPCEIAAEGDAVATETEQLLDIETGAGREADAIFATENTAKYQILADNAGQDKTVRLHISGKKDAHTAGCVEIVAKENSTLTVVMDSRVASGCHKRGRKYRRSISGSPCQNESRERCICKISSGSDAAGA